MNPASLMHGIQPSLGIPDVGLARAKGGVLRGDAGATFLSSRGGSLQNGWFGPGRTPEVAGEMLRQPGW